MVRVLVRRLSPISRGARSGFSGARCRERRNITAVLLAAMVSPARKSLKPTGRKSGPRWSSPPHSAPARLAVNHVPPVERVPRIVPVSYRTCFVDARSPAFRQLARDGCQHSTRACGRGHECAMQRPRASESRWCYIRNRNTKWRILRNRASED